MSHSILSREKNHGGGEFKNLDFKAAIHLFISQQISIQCKGYQNIQENTNFHFWCNFCHAVEAAYHQTMFYLLSPWLFYYSQWNAILASIVNIVRLVEWNHPYYFTRTLSKHLVYLEMIWCYTNLTPKFHCNLLIFYFCSYFILIIVAFWRILIIFIPGYFTGLHNKIFCKANLNTIFHWNGGLIQTFDGNFNNCDLFHV